MPISESVKIKIAALYCRVTHLWSLMMREEPEARGMGLPSLSIFIQRIGYSVAHSTEQSMSMVELLCRYSVDMV